MRTGALLPQPSESGDDASRMLRRRADHLGATRGEGALRYKAGQALLVIAYLRMPRSERTAACRRMAVPRKGAGLFRSCCAAVFSCPEFPTSQREARTRMYRKVSTDIDFVEREKRSAISEARGHHGKRASTAMARSLPLHGPAPANRARTSVHRDARHQDLIPRFQKAKGMGRFAQGRLGHHGLPMELEVEKLLEWTASLDEATASNPSSPSARVEIPARVGNVDRVASGGHEGPTITTRTTIFESEWWSPARLEKGPALQGFPRSPYCPTLRHRAPPATRSRRAGEVSDVSANGPALPWAMRILYILAGPSTYDASPSSPQRLTRMRITAGSSWTGRPTSRRERCFTPPRRRRTRARWPDHEWR